MFLTPFLALLSCLCCSCVCCIVFFLHEIRADVAHVINFDVPQRSIEAYTHRIGRTGRAGKEGLATSLITDQDESIFAALKSYLESTNNPVPERLARHPAATAVAQGNLIH